MNYTYEQIMEDDKYQEIVNCFFGLAKDDKTKKILEDILYTGKLESYLVKSEIPSRDTTTIERQRRISMAYLLINDPNTFSYLAKNNINLFHGTNGNALSSIIKYGLNNSSTLQEKKLEIHSGEYNYGAKTKSFISFTDVLDLARDYASLPIKNGREELSFSVILGTTSSTIKEAKRCRVASDLPEVGIIDNLSLGNIKCILVPPSKVQLVQEMLGENNITVLAMSREEEKFYYVDNSAESIEIYEQEYKELKQKIEKSRLEEMHKYLNNIKETLEQMKMVEEQERTR